MPGKRCRSCGRVGEWPGQPCPFCKDGAVPLSQSNPTNFDPITLHELGVHLRDQRWVDMHVDDERGTLVKRVQLTSIVVRVSDELVSCLQRFVVDSEDDDEIDVQHQNLVFEADAIWRVTSPSMFDFEDVTPFGTMGVIRKKRGTESPRDDGGHANPTKDEERVINMACSCASQAYGIDASDILHYFGGKTYAATGARYHAMLLVYDMTQLSTLGVCKAFGYKSQMPMQSARLEINESSGDIASAARAAVIRKRIREWAGVIDQALGYELRRQPPNSRWVLRWEAP